MKSNIKLGKVFGIPIGLNFSWFISLGFVVVMLALRVYPDFFPSIAPWTRWALAVAFALLFFGSILVHELAHSLVARRLGIPVKGITLFILGGVARISREAPRPLAEFIMAAVGPLASFVLAGLFSLLWYLTGADEGLAPSLWQWLWMMNLVLGLFNLMPGFPLDGGRLLRAILWGATHNYQRATILSTRIGQVMAYALIVVGMGVILGPRGMLLGLSPFNGLWLIVVGIFLNGSARQSYFQARIMDVLRRYSVAAVMNHALMTVDERTTVQEALEQHLHPPRESYLFVQREDIVVGVVEGQRLRGVPPRERATTTMAHIMTSASESVTAQPEDDMANTLQRMEMEEVEYLPVVEEGRVIGSVSRGSVLPLLRGHPDLAR